jgi:hypothetical protein
VIQAAAILVTLAILAVIVRDAVSALRPWPEPRAHHRLRCGGECRFSHDSAELFAAHVEAQHTDRTARAWSGPEGLGILDVEQASDDRECASVSYGPGARG